MKRLRARGTETEDVIQKRINQAKEESSRMDKYEYIVINDDLDTAVKEMHSIVCSAKFATSRCSDFMTEIKTELKNI